MTNEQWPLDAVYPMLYHGFYEEELRWIGPAVREGIAALPAMRPLYAGLFLPDLPPTALGEAQRPEPHRESRKGRTLPEVRGRRLEREGRELALES